MQSQSFGDVVVVVLSGSVLPEDGAECLALGADAYKVKTPLEEEQSLLVRELEDLLDRRRQTRG